MRIGLNTSAFGSVEVRTIVHANDVGLVIGSEKGDLHSLLVNDLPGIANTLQQQNLRLSQVDFQHGLAFANNFSGGDSRQRFVPAPTAAPSLVSDSRTSESTEPAADSSIRRPAGLSILA
jgi:hypothetical protein